MLAAKRNRKNNYNSKLLNAFYEPTNVLNALPSLTINLHKTDNAFTSISQMRKITLGKNK